MWRTRNIDLLDYEVAEALGQSLQFVRFYNRAKIYKHYRPKPSSYDEVVSRVCLEYFDDPEWLNRSLTSQGFRSITEATEKDIETMYQAVAALGTSSINPIDVQIYHEIYHLYSKQGLSVEEVAEKLRTSKLYVRNCLHKYKIPTNNNILLTHDPQVLRLYRQIRYYTPDTVKLRDDGVLIMGPSNVNVFMSPTVKKRESVRYRIEEFKHQYQWLPQIVPEYLNQHPDDDYPHWTIKNKIENPIEKRVAALRLLNYAIKCKDKHPSHPEEVIERAKQELLFGNRIIADDYWKFVEHFFGNEELKYYAVRPKQMFHLLTDATDGDYVSDNQIITSRALTEYLYKKRLRVGYLSPLNVARALLDGRVIGPVYDPYPGIGCLAIACVRLGIKYYYGSEDHIWNRAVDRGIIEELGGNIQPYDNSKVNYLMSQNLPASWYPMFGKDARVWSMVSGGNISHLKLGMRLYDVLRVIKVGNALRIVNFHPNEYKTK